MTAAYACAIPPLDQTVTSIGWSPGAYTKDPCGVLDTCAWTDYGVQFLANPGTPVVAPFPLTVVSSSPLLIRPGFASSYPLPIRVEGLTSTPAAGAVLDKGALLGRIANGQRGTKWVFWGPNAFGVPAQQQFILGFFHDLGLDIVGRASIDFPGFRRSPLYGGRLLARAGGQADCSTALHGLAGLGRFGKGLGSFLGSPPSGYVETPSSVYDRYGTSGQSDVSPPTPSHQNLPREAAEAAGGGLLGVAFVALVGWWFLRRG